MRGKERIGYFLDDLRRIWEKYPDLRLGQLLLNGFAASRYPNGPDLFGISDQELRTRLLEHEMVLDAYTKSLPRPPDQEKLQRHLALQKLTELSEQLGLYAEEDNDE